MVQRGGLDYVVKVGDQFSRDLKKFRDEIASSRATFRAFRRSLQQTISVDSSLQETAKAARDLSRATRELTQQRARGQTTARQAESNERRLEELQRLQASRLRDVANAARDAAEISARNNAQTREEAQVREQIVERILNQAAALSQLKILSENDRLVNGLTVEEEAWRQNEQAIQRNRTELERLRQLQARGDGRNTRGQTVEDSVERQRLRLLRELAEAEEALGVAADRRFSIDQQGQRVLTPLIQGQLEYTNILRKRAAEEQRLALLQREGLGADGLNTQQRALQQYNRQLEQLATQEERLRITRERTEDDFLGRTAQVRAETRATQELINTKARLLQQELAEEVVDGEGNNLNDLRAREAAERRIRKETQRRAEALAEIKLRQEQGLKVTRQLRREASGTADEFNRLNSATSRSIFSLRRLFLIFGAFEAARATLRGFTETIRTGVEFNANIEQAELAIGALIAAAGDIPGLFGEGATAALKLEVSLNEARRQNELLRQDALRTTATYEELVQAFQLAVAPGITQGGSLDQIREFTVQVSQAASALGLASNQLAEEIRSLLQGTVNIRTTRIAAALGITNEDIRRAQEAGVLFEFFQREFAAFNEAGIRAQQTFAGLTARLRETFAVTTGEAALPFFENLKGALQDILDLLAQTDLSTGLLEPNPRAIAVFQEIFNALSDVVDLAQDFADSLTFEEVLSAARSLGQILRAVGAAVIGAIDGIIRVFQRLEPVVNRVLDNISTESISNLSSAVTQLAVSFGLVQSTIRAFNFAVGAIRGPIEGVLTIAKEAAFAFLLLRASGTSLTAVFARVTTALKAFSVAFLIPFLKIAAAVAAVVVGVKALGRAISGTNLSIGESFEVLILKLKSLSEQFFAFIVRVTRFFLGDIPGIGDALDGVLERSRAAIADLEKQIDDVAKAANNIGTEGSIDVRFENGERIVNATDAFEALTPAISNVRDEIARLVQEGENLDDLSERARLNVQFEVAAEGLDIERVQFERSLELSRILEESTQSRIEKQARLNALQKESASIQEEIEGLGDSQLGETRLDFERQAAAFRTLLEFRKETAEVEKEITDLRREVQLTSSVEERNVLSERIKEREEEKRIRDLTEEKLKLRFEEFEASERVTSLATRQLSVADQIKTVQSDLVALSREEADIREKSARLAVQEVAALAAANNRSGAREIATLRERVNAAQALLDLSKENVSQQQLERQELLNTLRAQRLQSKQAIADLEARKKAFEDQLALAQQTPVRSDEIEPIERQIQQLEEQITLTRELNALQTRSQVQEFNAQRSARLEELRQGNELSVRQNNLLAEQVRAEENIARAVAERISVQERSVIEAQASLDIAVEQSRIRRTELQQAREQAQIALTQAFAGLDTEEIALATQRVALIEEELQLEFRFSAAQLDRLKTLRDISREELQIATIRRQFESGSSLVDTSQQTEQLRLQTQFEEQNLRLLQQRVSTRVRDVALARQATREAELALSQQQEQGEIELIGLEIDRNAALSAGDVERAEQLRIQRVALAEQVEEQGILLQTQVQINQELERQAELINSSDFFGGLAQGAQDFANTLPSLFQAGANIAEQSLDGLTNTLSDAVFIALDPRVEDKGEAVKAAFGQLGLEIAQILIDNLLRAFIAQLLQQLNILQSNSQIAGSAITTAGIQAGASLQAGGEAAGLAMVLAAQRAATILGGATATAGAGGGTNFVRGGAIPRTAPRSWDHFRPGVPGYAAGGRIRQPRTSQRLVTNFRPQRPSNVDRRDTTPIWAQPGEFMMRLKAVRKYGLSFMRMLNAGRIPLEELPAAFKQGVTGRRGRKAGYVEGGLIGSATASSGSVSRGSGGEVSALPVLVADQANVKRFLAGGRQEMLRFLAAEGFRPGR